MRLRPSFTLWLVLSAASSLSAQDPWPLVVAGGHVTFQLPLSMEVDSSSFTFERQDDRDVYTLKTDEQTIRAGSRDRDANRSSDSLRVANLIFDIEYGDPGSYAPLGARLVFSEQELEQLDEEMRVGFSEEAERGGEITNIRWDGTDIVQLEQAQAINMRLTGAATSTGEDYVVNIYIIQNYDAVYYVTISYLQAASDAWIPDLTTAFSSFQFEPRGGEQ